MSENQSVEQKVAEAFECNPAVNVFNVTSDGQCFAQNSTAIMHAKSLKNDKVIPVSRQTLSALSAFEPAAEIPATEEAGGESQEPKAKPAKKK